MFFAHADILHLSRNAFEAVPKSRNTCFIASKAIHKGIQQWILSGFKTISFCLLWSNILMVDILLIKSPNAITMQWGTSYSFQDLTLCVFWIITDIFNFVKHQSVWAWHFVKDASGARDVSITSIWIFVVSICLLFTKPFI